MDRELAFGNTIGIGATPTVFLNGKETEVVAPEQLLTVIREMVPPRSKPTASESQ